MEAETLNEPEHLICPITFVMFQDPVVVQSGNTYERSAIEEYWKQVGCLRDPLTNQILTTWMLFPNLDKRREVAAFLQQHRDYTPRGWTSSDPPSPKSKSLAQPPPSLRLQPRQRQNQWPMFYANFGILLFTSVLVLVSIFSVFFINRMIKRVFAVALLGDDLSVDIHDWLPSSLISSIADFGMNAARQLKMLSFGGIHGVVEMMKSRPQDLEAQQQCAQALTAFSARQPIKVAALGGIELVLQAMRFHSGSLSLQRDSLITLRNLAYTSEYQVSIAAAGGIEMVLHKLVAFIHDPGLLEQASHALGNLALNLDNDLRIASLGGIEIVLDAMRAFPKERPLQRECSRTLGNLALHSRNHEQLVTLGSVELLMVAMSTHPSHDLLRQSAWALGNLASSPDNQAVITSLGGVDRLLDAMKVRPQEPEMLRECSRAIGNLAVSFEVIRMNIAEKGGVDALLDVMQATLHFAGVQKQIAWALTNLASNPHNAIRIERLGGVDTVLKAKTFHFVDADLQEDYNKLFRRMRLSDEGKEKIQAYERLHEVPEAHSLLRDQEL